MDNTTPAAELPQYISHKKVWALKIKAIEQSPPGDPAPEGSGGTWLLIPENAGYAPIKVPHYGYYDKHRPQVGGYWVQYADGYQSFSPAKAFEEGNTLISPAPITPYPGNAPVLESELAAAAVAPRVPPAAIEANIASEHYFTARDGVSTTVLASDDIRSLQALGLLTFCVLVLRNGFTVAGQSACASPENFNADIGKRIAREDAVRQVWPLMGYELRSKLATRAQYDSAG